MYLLNGETSEEKIEVENKIGFVRVESSSLRLLPLPTFASDLVVSRK